jgi:ribosomal protein S18 acetylase RimI-like enzyme
MLVLRQLKENDKSEVLNLGRKIFREEDEIPLLKQALRQCDLQLSIVAVDASFICGFVLVCKEVTKYYFNFMKRIPNCYEIAFLGIRPDCQGLGIGSRLLKETLLAIFQKSKSCACWLLVDTINTNAIRLYKKIGFSIWRKTDEGKTPVPGLIMGIHQHPYNSRFRRQIQFNLVGAS